MLIEVVAKLTVPAFIAPITTKVGRVIDILRTSPEYIFSAAQIQDAKNFPDGRSTGFPGSAPVPLVPWVTSWPVPETGSMFQRAARNRIDVRSGRSRPDRGRPEPHVPAGRRGTARQGAAAGAGPIRTDRAAVAAKLLLDAVSPRYG